MFLDRLSHYSGSEVWVNYAYLATVQPYLTPYMMCMGRQ